MITVYSKEGIIHNPERTAITAKSIILRKRKRLQITADQARDAWTALESNDEDLESQIGTILSFPTLFVIWPAVLDLRGVSTGTVLWRDALEAFVRETREKFGALHGEPSPVCPQSVLARFTRDAATA